MVAPIDCEPLKLTTAVVVASVDCEPLELTDKEKRGVFDARALPDEVEETDEEPDVLLLILLVNDVNTVLEIEGEEDELRDSMGDIDNFDVTELEDDNRLLPLVEGDTVLVLDTALDKDGRVVAESCTDNF